MAAKGKHKTAKEAPTGGKPQPKTVHAVGSPDLAAEVKRLTREEIGRAHV